MEGPDGSRRRKIQHERLGFGAPRKPDGRWPPRSATAVVAAIEQLIAAGVTERVLHAQVLRCLPDLTRAESSAA
jgi:hypothetical protein